VLVFCFGKLANVACLAIATDVVEHHDNGLVNGGELFVRTLVAAQARKAFAQAIRIATSAPTGARIRSAA
jgi:hypothetical protein